MTSYCWWDGEFEYLTRQGQEEVASTIRTGSVSLQDLGDWRLTANLGVYTGVYYLSMEYVQKVSGNKPF